MRRTPYRTALSVVVVPKSWLKGRHMPKYAIGALGLLCTLNRIGCSSTELLRASDYHPVREHLKKGQPVLALAEFPDRHENNGFLTNVEKNYLSLLSGRPNPDPLLKISDQLEKREVIRVSQELSHFFYQEAEDGYLPAEHELIWSHLLLGLNFAAQNNREGARIEATRSAHLLQGHGNERTGDFDDPALRLILAGLWLYCDEWEHARVDLRRAGQMDVRYQWAQRLAERPSPPASFQVILSGLGPEPEWQNESFKSTLTGLESLEFKATDHRLQQILFSTQGERLTLSAPLSTQAWFERHQKRNHAIRDVVAGSRYLAQTTGQSALTGSGLALTKVASGTVMAAGIAVGAGILFGAAYFLRAAGDTGPLFSYVASFGVAAGFSLYKEGQKIDRKASKSLKDDWRNSLDPAPRYRYLRFLPTQVFATDADVRFANAQLINGRLESAFLNLESKGQKTRVKYYFVP